MSDIFTDEDMKQAETAPTLGPAYFASRRAVEQAMRGIDEGHGKPIIKMFTDELCDRMWTIVQDSLWSDTEMNLQGQMYRQVDEIVRGILSGEKWIMDRYLLGERYDCEKVRAVVAKHIPAELQDKRVADLEEEIKSLRESLKWAQR